MPQQRTKYLLWIPRKVLVVRRFLQREVCKEIRRQAPLAKKRSSQVKKGEKAVTNRKTRRSTELIIPNYDFSSVQNRLLLFLPELGKRFHLSVSRLETLSFLSYKKGDFFAPHADRYASDDPSSNGNNRKISIILFINKGDWEKRGSDYSGGILNLYSVKKPGKGVRIIGEPGMLVAFSSHVLHEVTPVQSGERLTIVTWAI